jgi:hypothetical protein
MQPNTTADASLEIQLKKLNSDLEKAFQHARMLEGQYRDLHRQYQLALAIKARPRVVPH